MSAQTLAHCLFVFSTIFLHCQGRTPLVVAIEQNFAAVCECLLQHGGSTLADASSVLLAENKNLSFVEQRNAAKAAAAAEEVINAGGSSGEAAAAASEALTAAMDAPRRAFMEVLDCLARMIFKDGFFHADPHPGNVN